jgi:hypothetical protein
MIKKIISGGQTGADRAELDVAIEVGIPHGGWVPKGRIAEDSPKSEKYHLPEMPTDSYPARTEQNVIDSYGTVIISRGKLTCINANCFYLLSNTDTVTYLKSSINVCWGQKVSHNFEGMVSDSVFLFNSR